MKKKLMLFLRIASVSYLLVSVSSCSSSTPQRSISRKPVTPYNPETDSILPPITYTLEELGDFKGPSIVRKSIYDYLDKRYLHFVDGKVVEDHKKDKAFKRLKKKGIESIEVIPGEEALELYGEKARHGAVIIRSKQ
ncbi:hypothetical protein GXP67_09460 [Rhodocytophaga rosea]|uniref:Uncharacterized protein n=1 Tax=Rhodocytophaga rosea TaxID=2704465 RepID=A0A6C0GFV3_9BACT|nr:hypothetical protein [Rhodocytophaga rosea]QHT66868.1 hypothetical protein GXP67_09460 [Rhodocytophaga rosea]